MQSLYCHLTTRSCSCAHAKVLSLPEADAWVLMENYHPSSEHEGADVLPPLPDIDQYRLQGDPADSSGGQQAEEGPSCEAALEAVELDCDDCCYEDMDAEPASHSTQTPPAASAAGLAPLSDLVSGTCFYSWDKLRTRVLHLGLQLSYAAVAHPGVWLAGDGGGGASDAVLELLRVLGIHDRSSELQPLLHTYANLLADRLCDDPSGMAACLEQLWEALGVAQLAASARPGQPPASAIPTEASVAFSLVLQLASQYGGAASAPFRSSDHAASASSPPLMAPLPRQELWRQVHGSRLLELAARCLSDIAAAPQLGPEQLAAASLISQVRSRQGVLGWV